MNAKTYLSVLIILILLTPVVIVSRAFRVQENKTNFYASKAYAQEQTIKELTVKPEQLSEHDQIVAYIKKVFGKDADKAFRLLKGSGKCGGENGSFNPLALNDNTKWGGRGKDWGVFQINDSWQGVNPKFLKNWKVNVEIAHQLFVENGHKFNLWTGGKCQGI